MKSIHRLIRDHGGILKVFNVHVWVCVEWVGGGEEREEPVLSILQSAHFLHPPHTHTHTHPAGFRATFLDPLASLTWSLEQTNMKQEPIGAPA